MCSCRSLHGISVEREPADGEISGLRTNHSPAPSIIAASRQFPTCFDRCHCYLPGCSSLHHDSQPTNATLISSALITSFLRNQIVTRLGKLSHSLIPFQSAPHQTANCPLVQSTVSLAAAVHLLPGVPEKLFSRKIQTESFVFSPCGHWVVNNISYFLEEQSLVLANS